MSGHTRGDLVLKDGINKKFLKTLDVKNQKQKQSIIIKI